MNEIRLYGPIGGWGATAEDILAQIPNGAKEITVRIHSPGGSVGEGLAIYHALRDNPAKVTTIVDGYAASSASFVMLAGDKRIVHRNSIVFVHNPWTVAEGNAEELRKTADGLDVHADAILDIYQQRTGMDEGDLRDMMNETKFFRGVDAVQNGFATEIADDKEAEMQIAAMLDMESIIAKQKGIQMSTQKTRKDIEASLVEMTAKVDEIKAAHEIALAEKQSEIEAKAAEIVLVNDKVAEMTAQIEAVNAKVAEIEAVIVEKDAEIEAKAAEIETAKAEMQAVADDLEKAKAALSNPAVADAVIGDAKAEVKAQADAEADAAEAAAKTAAAEAEPKNELEQWEGMAAGADRIAFWNKNKKTIFAQMEARGQEVK